ncbi:DciA family protein [Streptomyces sp. NPDC005899]|uniref:DciA family protein n=1 Tax=Streptomyces sp. NPDC005899 TaxID=3155716 RepID=UPI0033DD9E46
MSYDPVSGQLTVCPETSDWATQARLEQTRVIAAANRTAGRTVVSSLRILLPGAASVPSPADAGPAGPSPAAPTGLTKD